jgi:soluble lytic murein transglycosylase-like protein
MRRSGFVLLAWLLCAAVPALAEVGPHALQSLQERLRQGDPDAAIALARRHEFGLGVAVDLTRAADLYCDAALRGRGEAARRLASMFLEGEGVETDPFIAMRWLAVAERAARPSGLTRAPCAAGPAASAGGIGPADLQQMVRRVAQRHGVEPSLALALVAVESAFQTRAVSPRGAQGLMQLMPRTAAHLGVSDPFEPAQNVTGGILHLRRLLDRFRGDETLALAAYNAGEGAVERFQGVPPYAETKAYVTRVLWLRGRILD